ncbi:hypothetical protein BOTBODRAFT_28844 [Botryobasidium botryosum FD-172 SS1]|uniref:Protein kinase domain-containing protein n=1 Tax=Botryobasidium botryosum (strain FD-172 SS1) TaxID=930990 RepID=A0A067MRU9_BOTB1|nr:hypothetical protein BOTBODRAFT_28844 [Botryobasidium botryosum FD-172 SS1]
MSARDRTATISALLDARADPNARKKDDWPPLHLAAQHPHQPPSAIQLLLQAGADPRIRGPSGRTALHSALQKPGCATTVLSMLLDAGADPNAKDNDGETPLHYAVQNRFPPSATQLLLKSGADPRARDKNGRTPLFWATLATKRNTHWSEHVAALRSAGADIDDPDVNGVTPLYEALSRRSVETAFSLLQLGADPCAGHADISIPPRFIIDLIGKTSMETILAIVTRGSFQSEYISSGEDQRVSSRGFNESEKEERKVLVRALRERMLEQPTSGRQGFIAMLSTLYGMLDWYPPDPALHECEVALPQGRPSHFGGFADCWKGLFLGRHEIAMKTFRGSLAEEAGTRRLAREARVWSQLSHPNVLLFLGLCTLGSVPYLISPWMENGHALDFVRKQPDVDRLRLLAQVAIGLDYLHSSKPEPVIHGDLRGANILISLSGDARIADFGLSELKKEIYESYSTPFITAGNPRWQAPEILAADSKEAARRNTTTDVFAYGRVMLELFTADVPFSYIPGSTTVTMMVMRGELPQRPCDDEVIKRGLDDSVWQLMTDCWHATPSERPRAADLVIRLTEALKARSTSKSSTSKTEPSLEIALGESAHIHAESLTAHPLVRPGEAKSSPSEKESSTVEEDPTNERELSPRPRKRLRASD